ncbi:MAG: SRPBCC family protein [Promethearchaeota archaeon]
MPKLERKIEIKSTPEKIYNIVIDGLNTPKWNPIVTAVTPIEDDKIQLETDIGGITIINTETDENKSVTWHMEKSDMNSIGYILTPTQEATKVKIWTEFDDKKLSKLYKKEADSILTGLKNYVDFVENGGNPDLYKKWEVLTTP